MDSMSLADRIFFKFLLQTLQADNWTAIKFKNKIDKFSAHFQ